MSRAIAIAVVAIAFVVAALADAQTHWCDRSYMINDTVSPSPIFTVAQINAILKAHNDARRNVFPHARVMPMLQWSQGIADNAQAYIRTCPGSQSSPLVHSSSASRTNIAGFRNVGENLACGSGSSYGNATIGVSGTNAWNSELRSVPWFYGCGAFGGSCNGAGHYTQNIWATTTHVGCGSARCPWSCSQILICQYGPAGNFPGNPYVAVNATTPPSPCQNVSASGSASSQADSSALTEGQAAGIGVGVSIFVILIIVAAAYWFGFLTCFKAPADPQATKTAPTSTTQV
jgi:pathogenesis-related protein 1